MADPDAWSRMAAHVRREAALSAVCESLHVAAWSIGQLYSSHRQIRLPRRGASAPPRSWPFSSPHAGSRLAVRRSSVLYIVPFDDHTLTQGRDQSSRALRGSSLNPRSRTPVPERFARETASRVSCFVCLRSRVICDICKHSIVRSRLRRHALNMMRVRGAPGLRVPVRYRSNDNRQTTPVTGRHSPRDAASARRRGVRARRPRPPPRPGPEDGNACTEQGAEGAHGQAATPSRRTPEPPRPGERPGESIEQARV